MKTFLTSISECDKRRFVEDTIRIAEKNNQSIKYISIGDLLMNELKSDLGTTFVPENVLNLNEEFRALAIKNIIKELKVESEKYENLIISGHATFYWKNNFSNAFNWKYLTDLNPDLYITLIDNAEHIVKNMAGSQQFKGQKMNIDDISTWQNVEVNTVAGWAQLFDKNHYILPRRESDGLLYKTIMRPDIELVYASFPMSNIKTEQDKQSIDNFVDRLNEYFAVITPRSIELSKEFTPKEGAQTVLRDKYWFTGKAKKVIVYYMPHKHELVFSAGVQTEIIKGFETTKEILALYPERYYGPFEKYHVEDEKMFHSEDDFFKYLDDQGYKKHNIQM